MRGVQNPATRAAWVGLPYFKRKTHPPSLSEENPRKHGEQKNKGESGSQGYPKRLSERCFLRIRGGETNRDQDDGPNRKDVQAAAKDELPSGSVVSQKCRHVGRQKILRIDALRIFQERDWNGQQFSKRHGKVRENRDGERRAEIRSHSSNEFECSKIDRGRKQNQERPADDSPYVLRDFRSLSALLVGALLLRLWQALDLPRGELVFLDLLLGIVQPVRAFDERGT